MPLRVQLQREWDRLSHRPTSVAKACGWRVTEHHFDDLDGLLRLAGFGVGNDVAGGDRVLGAVVTLARTDELAARIVLERIMPGLLGAVRRWSGRRGCDGLLEEIVAAAWLVIRAYPVDRRPNHVAAGLVRDAAYVAFVRPTRRRSHGERPTDPQLMGELASRERRSPCEELAEVLADGRDAGVPESDLLLVRELLTAGSAAALADERHVTPRTIRNHRDIAVYRLRRAVIPAA